MATVRDCLHRADETHLRQNRRESPSKSTVSKFVDGSRESNDRRRGWSAAPSTISGADAGSWLSRTAAVVRGLRATVMGPTSGGLMRVGLFEVAILGRCGCGQWVVMGRPFW